MALVNGGLVAQHRPERPGVTFRLGRVINAVLGTYHVALEEDLLTLQMHLANLDPDMRVFAIEGAAMGLHVRDVTSPEDASLVDAFLAQLDGAFGTLPYVGIGLALVVLEDDHEAVVRRPWGLHRWFLFDGIGFMSTRLQRDLYEHGAEPLPRLAADELQVADRGAGRALWFNNLGDPGAVASAIRRFDPARRPWLWHGVGVASTMAGGVEVDDLETMRELAGEHSGHLALGCAFACWNREGVGAVTPYTQRAAAVYLGERSTAAAASIVGECRGRARGDALGSFLRWRDDVLAALA
jgi:hypothetical protein